MFNPFAAAQIWIMAAVLFAQPPHPIWVALCPPISEGRASGAPRGEFYRFSGRVEIGDGPVWLASTSDGMGALRTDDRALLVVTREDGSARSWSRDFREASSGAIVAMPAQDISYLFGRGVNTVTLTLTDALPPVFSSSAYYLVFTPASVPSAPPEDQIRLPAVLVTPVVEISATAESLKREDLSGVDQMAALAATAIPAPESVMIPTVTPSPEQTDPSWAGLSRWLAPALALAGLAALFGAFLAAGRRGRHQTTLFGLLNIYDKNTGERLVNADLTRLGEQARICLGPLSISAARPSAEPPASDLALVLTDETGIICVTRTDAGAFVKTRMQNGDALVIANRVTLEYRNPFQKRPAAQAGVASIEIRQGSRRLR